MAGDGPNYVSDDQRIGQLLGNLLNPPDDRREQMEASIAPAAPTPSPQPQPSVGPRPAAAALAQTQAPATTPAAPAVKPAVPSGVTPSASATSPAPIDKNQGNNWATDGYLKAKTPYYDQAQQGALDALGRSTAAANKFQDQPTATDANAPLEARKAALAARIPYLDPNTGKVLQSAVDPVTGKIIDPEKLYKPGIGTKIERALFPKRMGNAPINAPNANYQAAEAARQGQAGVLEQQEQRNIANEKADSERLGKIGTEQRAVATGYQDVAKSATAQQNADESAATRRDNSPEGQAAITQGQFDTRARLADQIFGPGRGGVNRTLYLVNGKLPDPRQATEAEVARAQAAKAWHNQNPGKTPTLDDVAAINAAASGFAGPRGGNRTLSPKEEDAAIQAKNTAIKNVQDALDKAGPNPDPDAVKSAQTDFQEIQDNWEQKKGITPDDPAHVTVRDDLTWWRGGVQISPGGAGQPAATQPAAAPAAAPAATNAKPFIQAGNGQRLTDQALAQQYRDMAGGDRGKARQLAAQDGWRF